MNYDEFRTLWHAALDAAGLLPHPLWPTETIDVHQMDRVYSLYVSLGGGRGAEPFYITARLEWNWGAALSARFATREEDLLTALLGRDGSYLVTEQPWLRADVTLNATLPWDSPLPMPGRRPSIGVAEHRPAPPVGQPGPRAGRLARGGTG